MVKNSFTLFETILSIFILSLIMVNLENLVFYDNFDEEYMILNKIENSFTKNEFDSNFSKNIKKLQIIENNSTKKELKVSQISFQNENIFIKKYVLIK